MEIAIDNKNGNVWDIGDIVSELTWKTSRIGKAGSLDFTLIQNGLYQHPDFRIQNGDVVRVKKGDHKIFYGYVFTIENGKDEDVKISCYDQIRYLMSNATYVFSGVTASQVLRKLATDFDLKLGQVDETNYKIPVMSEDGSKLLDIICKALDYTLVYEKENYFLFDDFGALSLRKCSDMTLDFYVGSESLLYDYSTKRSIDQDTYNQVKLYQDNSQTQKREVYMHKDSENIAKWGILQLYQSVDENYNEAQVNQLLEAIFTLKNRETQSLSIEAIGDPRVRAGCYVHIVIPSRGINQPFLVDECSHSFKGAEHTMSLELKAVYR